MEISAFLEFMPIIRATLNFFFHFLSHQDRETLILAGRKCDLTSSGQREPWKFNMQWSLVNCVKLLLMLACLLVSSAPSLGSCLIRQVREEPCRRHRCAVQVIVIILSVCCLFFNIIKFFIKSRPGASNSFAHQPCWCVSWWKWVWRPWSRLYGVYFCFFA